MALRSAFALVTAGFMGLGLMACASAPVADEATASDDELRTSPCALVRCAAGTHCKARHGTAACVPDAKSECTTDSDCRLAADYCTGCDCRALASGENIAACSGPGVRCFADPCMAKSAVCSGGQCVVQ